MPAHDLRLNQLAYDRCWSRRYDPPGSNAPALQYSWRPIHLRTPRPPTPRNRMVLSGKLILSQYVLTGKAAIRVRFSLAAVLAARLSEANAEAEEAMPAPIGKLFSLTTCAPSCKPAIWRTTSRNRLTRWRAGPDCHSPFNDNSSRSVPNVTLVRVSNPARFIDIDPFAGTHARVTVAPILDESDVWMTLGGCCGHGVMISLVGCTLC